MKEIKYINEYIKADHLVFRDEGIRNEIENEIKNKITDSERILLDQNVSQKDINNKAGEISSLIEK